MNLVVRSVGIVVVVCLCAVVVGSIVVLLNVAVVVLPPWSHLFGWSMVNKRLVALI